MPAGYAGTFGVTPTSAESMFGGGAPLPPVFGTRSSSMPDPEITSAAINAGSQLAGQVFSGKGANKAQDKQLAYMREQDAKSEARQREIDAAQKEEVARLNAYNAAKDAFASEYSSWRAGVIGGRIPRNTPPPTFKFEYAGTAAAPATLGGMASRSMTPWAPKPAGSLAGLGNPGRVMAANIQGSPETLGALGADADVPWDWNRKTSPRTLGSLVGVR